MKMRMKLLSSAILAAGLLAAAVAVQAADTIVFWGHVPFDRGSLAQYDFKVDKAINNDDLSLWTPDSFVTRDFLPFLAVWDSNGLLIGFDSASNAKGGARVDLGQVDDGIYTFTIGVWDNSIVGIDRWFADPVNNPIFLNTVQYDYAVGSGVAFTPGGWGNQYYVSVTGAIPEPQTWAMLLAGLGIVGAVARRRRLR